MPLMGVRGLLLLLVSTLMGACGAVPPEEAGQSVQAINESRNLLFEGSCHWLACCAKHDCSLSDSQVTGACGTGCTSGLWIARPNRDTRYRCGMCVRICTSSGNCTNATVWDNSVTSDRIEGSVALFDALGLSHSENATRCTGTGQATVTVQDC